MHISRKQRLDKKQENRSSYEEEEATYEVIDEGKKRRAKKWQGTKEEPEEREERGWQRKPRYRRVVEEAFTCKHCRRFVGLLPSGGHHRNHCPYCLYSRHVDDRQTGDRMSTCGSVMQPIGHFQRFKGEYVIVHRCLGCGFERFNRIAADDDFDLVLSLPAVPPRTSRDIKAQRWAALLADFQEFEDDGYEEFVRLD